MRILVVDDEGIVLDSCKRILEPENFDVISADSAAGALALIEKTDPALLLVDIKMPKQDGIYLVGELKKRERTIPIILMSGYNTEETVAQAKAIGASRFIAKPFTPKELLETVSGVIQKEVAMETMNALVIDDEQIVLDSVEKILSAENCEVSTSLRGKKGIRMALREDYDVVLTDIRMPDIGGLVVLRDIKRKRPALPVIIITGYATIRSAVQATKLGAADYIEKPFSPEKLTEAVFSAIKLAKTEMPEEQAILNKNEVIRVLERAASDYAFRQELIDNGSDALEPYGLTAPEKLAVITGDLVWVEEQIGPLTAQQKVWLELRLGAEIW